MDAASTFSVTTSAQVIATGGSIILQSTAGTFYVGGAGVTTSNGILVEVNSPFPFDLKENEQLYAIAGTTTAVRVFRSA